MWVDYPYNRPLWGLTRQLESIFGGGLQVTHFAYRNIEVGLDQSLCHFHFDEHFPLCIIGVVHCTNKKRIPVEFVEERPVGVDIMTRPFMSANTQRHWPRKNSNLNV